MLDTELQVPEFLRREKSEAPKRQFKVRWKKLPKATPPEGAVWENAERWEIEVPKVGLGKLAFGRRLVWVVVGRTRVRIADAGAKVKITRREWEPLARAGRRVA